jgi:hypothetical protein
MQDLLDSMNASELLLLAQENNPNAHRGLSREVIYDLILGAEITLPERHVDKVRLQIMSFVDENFKQVEPLVQACPAKTRDPRACFQCTDVQVVECALNNPIIFESKKQRKE